MFFFKLQSFQAGAYQEIFHHSLERRGWRVLNILEKNNLRKIRSKSDLRNRIKGSNFH